MRIRLIALDLDGTTLNKQSKLSDRTAKSLARAIAEGREIVFSTGRNYVQTPEEILSFPGITYLVTDNGARIYRMPEGELVCGHALDPTLSIDLLKECRPLPALIFMNAAEEVALDKETPLLRDERTRIGVPEDLLKRIPSVVDGVAFLQSESVFKMTLIFVDEQDHCAAQERLRSLKNVSVTTSGRLLIEIMSKGVGKGQALTFVADQLGIEMSETMAIGDHQNDIGMIRRAAVGIAVENAVPELKEAADLIALHHDDDAVAEILDALPPIE